MAGSLLNAIGLPELITTTLEAYEQTAIDLAMQPEKLAAIAPGGVPRRVYFGNSGAEVVEASMKLARYATGFGRALSLSSRDLDALGRGGFLHDIGKIAVPDHVLLKEGALDPEETLVMREHPIVGDTLCAGLLMGK
jgi:response regulator RpfG family c-di-GMP phosphodiesterase